MRFGYARATRQRHKITILRLRLITGFILFFLIVLFFRFTISLLDSQYTFKAKKQQYAGNIIKHVKARIVDLVMAHSPNIQRSYKVSSDGKAQIVRYPHIRCCSEQALHRYTPYQSNLYTRLVTFTYTSRKKRSFKAILHSYLWELFYGHITWHKATTASKVNFNLICRIKQDVDQKAKGLYQERAFRP